MGKVLSIVKTWKETTIPEDDEAIDKATDYLLELPEDFTASMETYEALRTVNLHLLKKMMTNINSEGKLFVNRIVLRLLASGKMNSCMKKLFFRWLVVHTEINSKNILLIKSFDIYFLEVLAKLILMLSETRSLRVIDSLSLYQLDDETSKLT